MVCEMCGCEIEKGEKRVFVQYPWLTYLVYYHFDCYY